METFTFIKITNPPAYEEVFIRSSTIDEVITKLSATLGATISFDAVTANTININKEWNRRKSSSMETIYEIKPDNKPRSVYAVYQLSYPIITSNSLFYSHTMQVNNQTCSLQKAICQKHCFIIICVYVLCLYRGGTRQ